MFRSEIGSGFEDTGGTPPPRIPRSTPPPPGELLEHVNEATHWLLTEFALTQAIKEGLITLKENNMFGFKKFKLRSGISVLFVKRTYKSFGC